MAFNIGLQITANNTSSRALNKVGSDLDKVKKKTQGTTKALKGLRLALGLIAVGVLVNFSKNIVEVTGKLQLMLIRLANVEGGAKQAKATFDKLFATFGSSPFTIDAVTDSFTRLRSAGIESKLAFDAVAAGADAIAAFGGTSEELKRFSIGLQQVAGKGVLSMEELRQQIGEALPVAMRVFATESGRSISEVISEVEKGRISADEFITNLTTGLQKGFGGFAQKLGDTVLGSIQGSKSKVQKAIADIFLGNTDVAVRLAAIFQNVGTAVEQFIRTISVSDVEEFFDTLKSGFDIVVGIAKAIAELGKVLLKFFQFVKDFVNLENVATVGTFGVIGFMLFGPVGGLAGILAGIASIGAASTNLQKALQPQDPGEDSFFNRLLNFSAIDAIGGAGGPQAQFDAARDAAKQFQKNIASSATANSGNGKTFADKIFGDDAQWDRIKKNLDDVQNPTKKLADAIQGLSKTSIGARKQLEGLFERSGATLEGSETFPFVKAAETSYNRLSKIMEDFGGDRKTLARLAALSTRTVAEQNQFEALTKELGKMDALAASVRQNISQFKAQEFVKQLVKSNAEGDALLAKFNKLARPIDNVTAATNAVSEKFRDMQADLEKQLRTQEALSKAGNFQTSQVQKLKDALAALPALRAQALALAKEQAKIDATILATNTKLAELQASQQIAALAREGRGGAATIFTSAFSDQADDRRGELEVNIEQTKIRILNLQKQINDAVGDPEMQEALERQKTAAERLQTAQQQAFENTTAAGLAAREMWQSVGDTIQNTAEKGLRGLIDGTKNFRDIAKDAYSQITDAAIKYLVELVKITIQKQAIAAFESVGGGAGGAGGGILGILGGLFANGGAFKGQVTPFASGGIVSGPTLFGLAGEAGDEAIMPLTRVGGKLGVETTGGGGGDQFAITIQAIDTQTGAAFLQKNADTIVQTMRHQGRLNNGVGGVR